MALHGVTDACPPPLDLGTLFRRFRIVNIAKEGTAKVSWEKLGKSFVDMLVVATSVAALYTVHKDGSGLEAHLTYARLT